MANEKNAAGMLGLAEKGALKRIAALLATVLTFEAGAVPLAQAAVIAHPLTLDARPNAALAANQIVRPGSNFIAPFRLPASIGSTVEIHAPVSAGRVVFHIQDVHGHLAAQTNLSDIISRLDAYAAAQNKTLLVAVEGGAGAIETDKLSNFPDSKAKEAVSAGLLRSGFLMGEEYAAIVNKPGRIKIVGVESPALYNRNVLARERTADSRERVLATVGEIKSQLYRLKEHNFNALLITLEKNRVAVEEGRMEMSDYLVFLSRANAKLVAKHVMVSRMLALNTQEKSLDFSKVEKEGRLLVEEIVRRSDDAAVQKMMAEAGALREGRTSPLGYYTGLLARSSKTYPTLSSYVSYLRDSEKIDADLLFAELQTLETEMAKDLVRHPLAYQLYQDIRWVERQERFFSLNMVPQEWAMQKSVDVSEINRIHNEIRAFVQEQVGALGYRFATPVFSVNDLKVAVRGASDFYRAAESRDVEMVSNLRKVLNHDGKEGAVVAFIAGGFHTPGLTRELRVQGFAYQVLRPQLEAGVKLDEALTYPATPHTSRLLPQTAHNDFLRAATNLTPAGAAFVAGQLVSPAPQISQPEKAKHAFFSWQTIVDAWKAITGQGKDTKLNDVSTVLVGGISAFLTTAVVIVGILVIQAIRSLKKEKPAVAVAAPVEIAKPVAKADAGLDFDSNDARYARIPSYLKQLVVLSAMGGGSGSSGDVIARLNYANVLDVAKDVRNHDIAAIGGFALVYVGGDAPISISGKTLIVPERYVRSDSSDNLDSKDIPGYPAQAALDQIRGEWANAGTTPSRAHDDALDATYTARIIEALGDSANQSRFVRSYPQIIAAAFPGEMKERGSFASDADYNKHLESFASRVPALATQWYAASAIADPNTATIEQLQAADQATNNLSRLIELLSAVPETFLAETEAPKDPLTYDELGAKDSSLSPDAIAKSARERDLALYYGLFPLRMFAGGSWSRGGLNLPAALVTSANLATAGGIDLNEFPDLFADLPMVARPILDRRLAVEAAAERLGLPVDAGLANQVIELGLSSSNSAKIDEYLTDAGFLGFPSSTFRFWEQRTAKGFGLTKEETNGVGVVKQTGNVQDVPYGHLEPEIKHNEPNEYYVLDKDGIRHQGAASLNRILSADGKIILHQQISLLHAWREGWSTRPERIHYVLEKIVKGTVDAVFEFHDNSASGQKGGLRPEAKGGVLSDQTRDYLKIPAGDTRRRVTIFTEGNMTQTPEGKNVREERAGVFVNAGVTAYRPEALEKVASLERSPLILTVRSNTTKRMVGEKEVTYKINAGIYPDGPSYVTVFNQLNADEVAPSKTVRADGVADVLRFEVKVPAEFRQSLETAQRQDQGAAFRELGGVALATAEANREKRQPISSLGLFITAALFIAGGVLGAYNYNFYVGLIAVAGLLPAVIGILAASVTGSKETIADDTAIESLVGNPAFDQVAVQKVIAFASAARPNGSDEPLTIKIQSGIVAEADASNGVLTVGQGLLEKSDNLFVRIARGVVLYVALQHELIHFRGPQVSSASSIGRFINELIAYPLGLIAAMGLGFLFTSSAPINGNTSLASAALTTLIGGVGKNVRAFYEAWAALLASLSDRRTNAEVPSHLAIDFDSIDGLGKVDGKNQDELAGSDARFMKLISEMHLPAADSVEANAMVVFYTLDAGQSARIQNLIAKANVPGVTFQLAVLTEPLTDVSALFRDTKNLTAENTVILSGRQTTVANARLEMITGVPHLALATFAYSRYSNGGDALRQLVILFNALNPEFMHQQTLTESITNAIVAAIQA